MKTETKGQEVIRGSKNRKEQGIALTVMLVVLMFAATLSFGTLFLTQNNLKVAENIRNHAIAKYNAEAGIEISHIMLNVEWEEKGEVPTVDTADSIVPLAVSATETAFNYHLEPGVYATTDSSVYLAIVGKSGPDASYTTEMLAQAVASSSTDSPKLPLAVYGQGIVSKTTVSMNNMQNTKLRSTRVHGNKGYTLNGRIETNNITICTKRNDDGGCDDVKEATDPWAFFSASMDANNHQCNADPRSKLCPSNKPRNLTIDPFDPWNADGTPKNPQPPVISAEAALLMGLLDRELVDAQDLQDLGYLSSTADLSDFGLRELADTNRDGVANYDSNYGPRDNDLNLNAVMNHLCSQFGVSNYNGQPINRASDLPGAGFIKNKVVCVKNHWVNLPDKTDLENMTILVQGGGINFNGDVDLMNTTLVTTAGINLNSGSINSSLIYAKQSLNLNNNAKIIGITSILGGSNVTHNGRTVQATNETGPVIGLNMVAKGNLTFNGSTDGYGVYQSRGSFITNGNSNMYGSVIAEKQVIFNNSIDFDSSLALDNPTLEMAVPTTSLQAGGFIMAGRR